MQMAHHPHAMLSIHNEGFSLGSENIPSRRRIVRAIKCARGCEREPQRSARPFIKEAKVAKSVHLPFHLSPRPLFTPHIMDSLLCDIINHSRQQRGQRTSSSPVLLLNEPWVDHERKVLSKRRREQNCVNTQKISTISPIDRFAKMDELRLANCVSPLDLRCSNAPCKRRKRFITPQDIVSLDNQVSSLRVSSEVEIATCAMPRSLLNDATPLRKVSCAPNAHVLAFQQWNEVNKAPPLIEELELTEGEESSLNDAFENLGMASMLGPHPLQFPAEVTPSPRSLGNHSTPP